MPTEQQPLITILASDAPAPRTVPTLDELIAAGVHDRLSPLQTSSRMFMTDSNAQDLYNVIAVAVAEAETTLGAELPVCRAALARVRADGCTRLS